MIGSRRPDIGDDRSSVQKNPAARWQSRIAGEVALANLPPYGTKPWLSMGVVFHYALLSNAGIPTRVVRAAEPPFVPPRAVADPSLHTFVLNPTMDERMERMEQAYAASPEFFDGMVERLLAGGERLVGLCAFRNNVDVSLWTARLIKRRSPDTFVFLGGPETSEEPASLQVPWLDAVIGIESDAIIVPLVRAVLAGRPQDAARLRNVWLNPEIAPSTSDPTKRPRSPRPDFPTIDYAPLVPLVVGELEATMPLLLNWGCPHRCAFCSNLNVYSRFTEGSVQRVLDEMDAIMDVWDAMHVGQMTGGLNLQLSDATTNAIPVQFDHLLNGVMERRPRWKTPGRVRGQLLFDARITQDRARMLVDADFHGFFFGLDSGSDAFRKKLKKPGRIDQVAEAMRLYHQAGGRGMNFGAPVGMPGETDAYFRETYEFFDWAMGMSDALLSVTTMPYVYFLSAQDPAFNRINIGEPRGLMWRTNGPAGDPAVRARRFMQLIELVDGRVDYASPIPPYIALPVMLADEDPAEIESWLERYGYSYDQLQPRSSTGDGVGGASLHPTALANPAMAARWSAAAREFLESSRHGDWSFETFAWQTSGMLIVFQRETDGARSVLLFEELAKEKPAFERTQDFNVSYLERWQNIDLVFDEALIRSCIQTVNRALWQ